MDNRQPDHFRRSRSRSPHRFSHNGPPQAQARSYNRGPDRWADHQQPQQQHRHHQPYHQQQHIPPPPHHGQHDYPHRGDIHSEAKYGNPSYPPNEHTYPSSQASFHSRAGSSYQRAGHPGMNKEDRGEPDYGDYVPPSERRSPTRSNRGREDWEGGYEAERNGYEDRGRDRAGFGGGGGRGGFHSQGRSDFSQIHHPGERGQAYQSNANVPSFPPSNHLNRPRYPPSQAEPWSQSQPYRDPSPSRAYTAYSQHSANDQRAPYDHRQQQPFDEVYGGYDDEYGGAGTGGKPKRKEKEGPSEVSRHIIFLGLDPEMKETDLFDFLKEQGAQVESTTIIRDKITGASRGFGFALFAHTTAASTFLHSHFPSISIPFPSDAPHPRRVKIDFSASPNQPGHQPHSKNSWGATLSSGSSSMSDGRVRRGAGGGNDGMRDIGGNEGGENRVLLIRGVDVLARWKEVLDRVVQEVFEFSKSQTQTSGQDEYNTDSTRPSTEVGSTFITRLIGIRDKETGGSWGFCFLEMRTAEHAIGLLNRVLSPTIHPTGFRLDPSPKPVSISYANPAAFGPKKLSSVGISGQGKVIDGGGQFGLGGTSETVAYWDDGAELVEVWAEGGKEAAAADAELASFLSGLKADPNFAFLTSKEGARVNAQPTSALVSASNSAESKPISSSAHKKEEIMVPIAIGGIRLPKAGAEKVMKSVFQSAEADEEEEEESVREEREAAAAKAKGLYKVPPMASSRKIANSINKWNTKQSELASEPAPSLSAPSSISSENLTPVGVPQSNIINHEEPDGEFEFSDKIKLACLLCQRQLKSLELLSKHNQASDLHKKNLQDATLREVARNRVKAAREAAGLANPPTSEYVDRASQRRTLFNQPEAPVPVSKSANTVFKRKFVEGPTPIAQPAPPPPPVPLGQDQNNVGNKMLAKMGWKDGQGLGISGEGRVDPVQALQFAHSAGLGSVKPKDSSKTASTGEDTYSAQVRDSARNRYN
ncbi:RNA-binding protein RBM5 and related proteins, contain G-patch and RRM domains [Phaffia rhodozyma]|uniref:RNA-binding protein RBM5 and related proteins, contain G-patch and RRM domains n=1 Tax=Phaffia rhodozyma TaxID=264483 RepID=A0A0F7SQG9_PHARH|nr:RNA-binding protein RBM5 and related proteins, contain G-patch and RRM domains [Phaffia rhodozyma]